MYTSYVIDVYGDMVNVTRTNLGRLRTNSTIMYYQVYNAGALDAGCKQHAPSCSELFQNILGMQKKSHKKLANFTGRDP